MTISEALNNYPNIEAELLLGYVLKESKEFLYLNPDQKLTAKQAFRYEDMAAKRIKGIPVAYIVGFKDFYGMKFKVTKDVLIPRPETEWLVEEAIRIVGGKSISVLDVGTGSGCIAISIAKNSRAIVTATDISDRALAIAKSNWRGRNKVKFIKSDLLERVEGKFDLVIANLPYVPETDYKKFLSNLMHEPKLALTDGTDEFVLITKFLDQAKEKLNSSGTILLETDPASIEVLSKKIQELFQKVPVVTKDLNGLDRFITITTT